MDRHSYKTAHVKGTNGAESGIADIPGALRGRNSFRHFYCPFCRSARGTRLGPDPWRLKYFLQVGLTSVVLALAVSPWMAWRGAVFFFPLWIGFEVIFRARARRELGCPRCGFDPYLYLSNVPAARAEIEERYRKKFEEKGIPFPERPSGKAPGPSPISTA